MSVQSRRGRKVARNNRSSLSTFYLGVGAALIVVIGFVGVFTIRNNVSSPATALAAPVGRTADGHYYKGNPEAAVKVIEYGDYQCPSCADYDRSLARLIDRDYVNTGKVQFIYHELPLTSIHPNAQISAEAARCAGDQGIDKYWLMHDMLFQKQDQWALLDSPLNVFSAYAGQIGLDRNAFVSCVTSGTNRAVIAASEQAGMAAGISSTPTFDVNGTRVTVSQLDNTIMAALRAAGQ